MHTILNQERAIIRAKKYKLYIVYPGQDARNVGLYSKLIVIQLRNYENVKKPPRLPGWQEYFGKYSEKGRSRKMTTDREGQTGIKEYRKSHDNEDDMNLDRNVQEKGTNVHICKIDEYKFNQEKWKLI